MIANDTILQPDVSIVCGAEETEYLDFAPSLVAEILSPSSVIKDRNTKFRLYEAFGIKYYMIIDTKNKGIEVYQLNDNHTYELLPIDPAQALTLHFQKDCSIAFDPDSIW